MSFKRKTSAPIRVLVDPSDTCQSNDVITPADHHDYDSDQSHDRSLQVVTSPSSLSAEDDDDVTSDVTTGASILRSNFVISNEQPCEQRAFSCTQRHLYGTFYIRLYNSCRTPILNLASSENRLFQQAFS